MILRSRPDVVAEWDDFEVARQWLMLCPERRDKDGEPEVPSEFELNHMSIEDGESAQETRVVPLEDQSRQESRVGDTGNLPWCMLNPKPKAV